jgi:hypothetical protein
VVLTSAAEIVHFAPAADVVERPARRRGGAGPRRPVERLE